jgi:hypothetical protein
MHLDQQQRRLAMPNLAALVQPGGTVIMKIRHGPVPVGRRMFEVSPEETIELAEMQALLPVLNLRTESISRRIVQPASPGSIWRLLVNANKPLLSSWPSLSRPSTSFMSKWGAKTWMPGTGPA